MPKITLQRLKKIIQEEMKYLQEGEEHDSAAKIVNSATKLISVIESSKENFSEKAISELNSVGLDQVEQILKRIISSPLQYVDATAPPAQKMKKVTLKAQK